jgi:hypothetical protein
MMITPMLIRLVLVVDAVDDVVEVVADIETLVGFELLDRQLHFITSFVIGGLNRVQPNPAVANLR